MSRRARAHGNGLLALKPQCPKTTLQWQAKRQLNGVYTQPANRTHGRVGHVFQGRFKAILIDEDNYLLELARYVVLNPVRAGVVQEAKDWPCSSVRVIRG